MSDRNLALLDLQLRRTPAPPPATVEGLARDGFVRIIDAARHAEMVRHAQLRALISELDAERHEFRDSFVWPWRRGRRARRIDELTERLDAHRDEAREVRARLHADSLARVDPDLLTPLRDGRYAAVLPEGANHLHAWAYSDAFDEYIDADAGPSLAETCMRTYHRLVDRWRVAYPPPTVATAAALLCTAGGPARDERLEHLIALFTEWRRRYRDCPADRLMLAAMMALSLRDGEKPLEAEQRALDYQEALRGCGFPRERETLWAGALLAAHGADVEVADRVRDVWRGLIRAGWSMSAQTYIYAARLSLARGRAVRIASRTRAIFGTLSERLIEASSGKEAAASILAHSALHPRPTRRTAALLDRQSRWEAVADRAVLLCEALPPPTREMPGADVRPPTAAILAARPGSQQKVREVFDATLAALREHSGSQVPMHGATGIDPLTGAALLLMGAGWGGRADSGVFAKEACACCRNEDWDELTIFRFSPVGSPKWHHSGG